MAMRIFAAIAGAVLMACGVSVGPAGAEDTIKIAYTDPLSGPFAQVGDANLKQMQYIIDYINTAKGRRAGQEVRAGAVRQTSRSRPTR